jgi:hypothetical protein
MITSRPACPRRGLNSFAVEIDQQKGNLRYAVLGADISHDWDDLAGNVLAMCLNHLLKLLLSPPNNVDFRTVDSQSLGDHKTNTTSSTSDEGDLVLDVKELVHLEFGVVGRHVGVVSLLLGLIRNLVCVLLRT